MTMNLTTPAITETTGRRAGRDGGRTRLAIPRMRAAGQPAGWGRRVRSTAAAAPVLAARSLSAGYGGAPVVRGLDLEVRAGEVVVLLGPNGAGKTTTLLTLAGALAPLGGEVHWAGRPT